MIINTETIKADAQRALAEDVGLGDVSAVLIPVELTADAEVIAREPLVVCGIPWFNAVMAEIDPSIDVFWLVNEGDWISKPRTLCRVHGCAQHILTAERTALNFLQTLSATATQTRLYLNELKGTSARLLDTRKTIPGLRVAQKYAVACAGGVNHRLGLYDAVLIKENHIKACGSIALPVRQARELMPDILVEVEVENLDEFHEAIAVQPDRILLDNFTLDDLVTAVVINQPKRCDLEASGGITLANIKSIAETGVDFISVGCLTKSIQAIDLSLLIREIS